ncbi:U3 small nucleolar RNA-associated protein MPP10, partial [Tremellales sp. Uapishka_1]
MSVDKQVLSKELPGDLDILASRLDHTTHHLASSGDEEVSKAALQVTKSIFDLGQFGGAVAMTILMFQVGLSLETLSHPQLHPFLISILQPPSHTLRSSTKKAKDAEAENPDTPDPSTVLPYTPLSALTVDHMDNDQVWQQLELRTEGVAKVVEEVGAGGADGENDEDEGEESDSEEGSEEELSLEEFNRLMREGEGEGSDEEMTLEEFERMMSEREAEMGEDGSDSDEEGGFKLRDEEDDEDMESGSDEMDSGSEDIELGSDEEMDEDDEDGEDEDEGDENEDEDEDEEAEDEEDLVTPAEDDDEADLFAAGPSQPRKKGKSHPTLDDSFFSIDEFNAVTEQAEAGHVSSGRLGGDEEDEDEELGDIGGMMLQGAPDEDENIMYSDFFPPPKEEYVRPPRGSGKDKGKGKERKSSGKGVRFGADKVLNEDESEHEDEARGVMSRVKGDLFDDEGEEDQVLSTHEKRQLALAKQIAELEQDAIGPKDWTLLGEAGARARPENSLLEEDLDFEQVGKVVPVITEDTVKTLEELIKLRIRDNNFNDPIRVRAFDPTPFLPSRFFDLQDTQSTKSLAQIYEDEYQAATTGGKVKDPRDEKLKKDHEEIDRLWNEVCYKLDALSSLYFVPKQPKAQITTITNLPTTSLESALPPTSAATTMLAPEEMFAPASASALVSRSELTPEEKQKQRGKHRKAKQALNQRLDGMAELYGRKKQSKKEEKEKALQGLVKSGKGVTVVGKGEKEMNKAGKRARGDEGKKEDGKRLKL